MRISSTVLAALRIAVVALLGTGAGSALAAPEIVLVPDFGAPGDAVGVSGAGFPPFSSVLVGFSQNDVDEVVGFAATDGAGTFTALVAVPEDAEPGLALFFAGNSLASAEADFLVTDSEPIGDTPGPPAAKVPVCKVTVLLERVRNRIGSVAGSDSLSIKTHARPAGANADAVKSITDTFVRDEWTNVATTIASWRQPKHSFPKKVTILPFVRYSAPGGGIFSGANLSSPLVDCEETKTVEFVEVRDDDGDLVRDDSLCLRGSGSALIGCVDLTYRIIVREER